MVLDASLLNTQLYKESIMGKEHPLLQLDIAAIEKGAFGSPLTMFDLLMHTHTHTHTHIHTHRSARGVMVIVVENKHGDTGSNPGRD